MNEVTNRNNTRNQSTMDVENVKVFLGNNSYQPATFKNNTAAAFDLKSGVPVIRNAGTFESASMAFSATPLSAGQTITIAGLTFTSTGATTQAQAAAAFANLTDGATTGAGTGQGTYTGALLGYSTGAVSSNAVVFTASTTGNKTNLAATGTGALPTATVTAGTDGVADGVLPATIETFSRVIGVAFMDCPVSVEAAATLKINYGTEGWIDETRILLPAGLTLDSVPAGANKTCRDILNGIGFALIATTQNTKYDN